LPRWRKIEGLRHMSRRFCGRGANYHDVASGFP